MSIKYAGKLVLAPMVRAGELPTRLLAIKYNSDLVWSPEIIDKKIIQTERIVNSKLNTVDYVLRSKSSNKVDTVVFRTCRAREQDRLVFQMGSCNADIAVQAALHVIRDVDGIDINAGCPKHFSIHAGMGAALLSTPDLLCDILKNLVDRVGIPMEKPISVKIRLLPERQDTLTLVERLCQTGIKNLTVHCRTREMRNREAPIRDYLNDIYQVCQRANVSLIINGAIENRSHFIKLKQELNLPEDIGAMIAECAEANPTVFATTHDKMLHNWWDVSHEFIKIAIAMDNHIGNTKYMLSRIVPGKSKFFQFFARCKDHDNIRYIQSIINRDNGQPLEDPSEYLSNLKKNQSKKRARTGNANTEEPLPKKINAAVL